jgi:uncharacterized surface protein with fasciclin (FAS1) repeats
MRRVTTFFSAHRQGRVAPLSRVLPLCLAVGLTLLLAACGEQGEPVEQAGPNETANEPEDLAPTATEQMTAPRPSGVPTVTGSQPSASIDEVLTETTELSTVASLLDESGVAGELDDGPYTVFAPTDDAFAALGITPDTFANNCPAGVTDILLYHVAPGRWSADRIIDNDGGQLPTVNGDPLDVTIDGGVFIDQAQVIAADVKSSNGFIHAINAVLLPGS